MLVIFKFALAFVATPILASLLQPLFVRMRLGRDKLFAAAAFLSLLVLLLREKYGVSLYYSDIIAYVAGAFSGLVFLWLWIERQIRWLKATARDDVFFKEFDIPREMRLRHLFRFAQEVEDAGAEFYRNMAALSAEDGVRKVCEKLANDEQDHKKTLRTMISRWAPLPDDERIMERLRDKMKGKGIFSGVSAPLQWSQDVLYYAIDQEKRLLTFYLGFEKAFPDAWKKAKIKEIANMERTHIDLLKNILSGRGKEGGTKT